MPNISRSTQPKRGVSSRNLTLHQAIVFPQVTSFPRRDVDSLSVCDDHFLGSAIPKPFVRFRSIDDNAVLNFTTSFDLHHFARVVVGRHLVQKRSVERL